jgi:hypothetical protein
VTETRYWFECTVAVSCPYCKKRSVEKLVFVCLVNHPGLIGEKARLQTYSCQLCKRPFPSGVRLHVNVSPGIAHDVNSSVN